MYIELEDVIYETYFEYTQIEITGMCNMKCKHCRAVFEPHRHITLEEFNKVIDFINANRIKEKDYRVTLSGGEPFLHPKIVDFLKILKQNNIETIVITTNGSCVTKKVLEEITAIGLQNLCIQVSLDSYKKETHDSFRCFNGAFDKALETLKLIKNSFPTIQTSIRCTLTPTTLNELEQIVDLGASLKVDRIGAGTVIPVGNGGDGTLTLTKKEKQNFLGRLVALHNKYKNSIDITTEDPTKYIIDNSPWKENFDCSEDQCMFGGCTAGISAFNVSADGTVLPCSVLWTPIMNIYECKNIEEMNNKYSESSVIKRLVSRQFSGKCGKCKFKYKCGGCRATAYSLTGDFMGEDPTCFNANID